MGKLEVEKYLIQSHKNAYSIFLYGEELLLDLSSQIPSSKKTGMCSAYGSPLAEVQMLAIW